MARVKLILKALAGLVAFATYVWVAAVRAVPAVRARKAARRR
jgi:parvulin-like peptidyl-prolyl isomerase